MRIVSESIAHDDKGFYCRLCGRAGYRSLAAVKGHLSQCPGKLIQKGVLPAEPQLPAAGLGWVGRFNNAPLETASPAAPAAPAGAVGWPASYGMQEMAATVRENAQHISRMQNEYTHLLTERNQPQEQSWVSRNLGWLVLAGIGLLALFSAMGQASQCPVSGPGSGSGGASPAPKPGPLNNLGVKLLGKAGDRLVTKAVDKAFS